MHHSLRDIFRDPSVCLDGTSPVWLHPIPSHRNLANPLAEEATAISFFAGNGGYWVPYARLTHSSQMSVEVP